MGRSWFAALAVALIAFAGCGWTQYAGNAGRTGYAPLESGLTTANAGQAIVKWRGTRSSGAPVVANGFIYGAQEAELHAWNITSSASCSGALSACPPTWWSHTADFASSAPVLVGDTVFVAMAGTSSWHLYAFDAAGRGDCTSSPAQGCLPKWVGIWGSRSNAASAAVPFLAAADGRVFVQTLDLETRFSDVTAFDASGTTNCAGSPRTCSPLFHTTPFVEDVPLQPTVAGGRLFVPTNTSIGVFDAQGIANCTAGACAPVFLLSSSPTGEVAVADGQAFATSNRLLLAFDATGQTNCSGTLPLCQPLWRADLTAPTNHDAPIIAGNRVFANSIGSAGVGVGVIEAFDRVAGPSCGGFPLTCPRLFSTHVGATFDRAHAVANANLLMVASGTLPNPGPFAVPLQFKLTFFDLTGTAGCSGAPKTCQPLGSLDLGSDSTGTEQVGRPALGAGLVVVPHLFDSPIVVGLP
jgi:hypothetical protein